jgi:hypothetical protein
MDVLTREDVLTNYTAVDNQHHLGADHKLCCDLAQLVKALDLFKVLKPQSSLV